MRAALVLGLVLLAGCVSNLQVHAHVASVSADVLDELGAHIEREAHDDYEAAKQHEDFVDRAARLRHQYAPLEAAYAAAKRAHDVYLGAIRDAVARGEKNLRGVLARPLLGTWLALANQAEAVLGTSMPRPPQELVELAAGGEP